MPLVSKQNQMHFLFLAKMCWAKIFLFCDKIGLVPFRIRSEFWIRIRLDPAHRGCRRKIVLYFFISVLRSMKFFEMIFLKF